MSWALKTVPAAGELQPGNRHERGNAEGAAEPHERQHQPAGCRIAVGWHWVTLAVFWLVSTALCVRAASVPVLVTTNGAQTWYTGCVVNASSAMVKLQGTANMSATLTVLTVTNATGSLSNGVGHATITVSSNDWATMTGGTGIHSNLWEVTITHQ